MAKHEIDRIALAYVHCSCGWAFRQFDIKGKSDEDLAVEMKAKHAEHIMDMES